MIDIATQILSIMSLIIMGGNKKLPMSKKVPGKKSQEQLKHYQDENKKHFYSPPSCNK